MWCDIKILVVDDTPANLEIVTEILSSIGYGTATAISGDRALKRLQTYTPDLILLDVQMPGIDGFETCRQIKANLATADIPIIFMTALSDAESKVQGFELGAVDYITKPFHEKELLARVKTHLNLRQWSKALEDSVAERTHELQIALEQLKQFQLKLIQAEKMSTLGNLVAGVAHEINNPTGFLKGSISNAKEYVQDLLTHIQLRQQYESQVHPAVKNHAEDIDLEFLCKDLPKLVDSMQSATDRIISISTSLRTFSRSDTEHQIAADIHEGINSALLILKYRLKDNQYRPAIEVIQDYGNLPKIECFPGQLNQVFMNILANAIDMFDEIAQGCSLEELEAKPQQITIRTEMIQDQVQIRIRDNGKGITEDVKARVFDHLFTTKGVGKGTGLGLAIAHQIVTEQHQGTLDVYSEPGQGTEFCIQIPAHAAVSNVSVGTRD
ncbi:sensor histidine kinase [Leptolyngbya sp. AN02str]|uniref:sensor histidine kinase n=1 Tax=Leptolyngbya sp. AN02str TaxID=3423363 RepID=UPI003D317118